MEQDKSSLYNIINDSDEQAEALKLKIVKATVKVIRNILFCKDDLKLPDEITVRLQQFLNFYYQIDIDVEDNFSIVLREFLDINEALDDYLSRDLIGQQGAMFKYFREDLREGCLVCSQTCKLWEKIV